MDIAVIGISGKNSIADNMTEFHENLSKGASGSKSSPERRGVLMGNENYDEIIGNIRLMSTPEVFDHKFFGIAKSEARKMSPEIRIGLEYATKAVSDAGYSMKEIKGSDCGIVLSVSSGEKYRSIIDRKDAFCYTGSSVPAMCGNQISYRLDLRGSNYLVDSACCSSAMALHDACMRLSSGDCEMMLVGAVEVILFNSKEDYEEIKSMGIVTERNYCSPADESVDGILPGEGCGFMLLKPLEKAVCDGDHIYGVIKGTASGGNGSLTRDITSPSSEAEERVMKKAFRLAGIDSDDITEIELHAAGSPIGDAIEFHSLSEIFKDRKNNIPIPVSAVKGNIGHTGKASGILSVIKVISGFNNNVIYPIAHLENISHDLELGGGVLSPVKELVNVPEKSRRVADIASYGINGSNVHIVLENYVRERKSELPDEKYRFVKVSARTESSFALYTSALISYFSDVKNRTADAVYTLNCGRDDYSYRGIISFDSYEDLIEKLRVLEPVNTENTYSSRITDTTELIADYLNGAEPDWNLFYENTDFRRASVPSYVFDDTVIWAFDVPKETESYSVIDTASAVCGETNDSPKSEKTSSGENIDEKLKLIWLDALETDEEISEDDSFFELGGNSLLASIIAEAVQEQFGIDFEIKDIYEYPTIKEQADYIASFSADGNEKDDKRETVEKLKLIWLDALETDEEISEDDSFFELGGNSLLASIIAEAVQEQFGIDFEIKDIYEYPTIREQTDYIVSAANAK